MRVSFRKAWDLFAIDIKSQLSMKKSHLDIKTHKFIVAMIGIS